MTSAAQSLQASSGKTKTLDMLDAKDKKVIVRVDFNVPVQDGKITDTSRIDRVKPTIDALLDKGAAIILMAHFGRPKGKVSDKLSLKFLQQALFDLWNRPIQFCTDCVGDEAESITSNLKAGDILLLENLRFHAEEEQNNAEFAQNLASLGDVYVNDAFSVSHRAHASTQGITQHLPSYAGLLMQSEVEALETALETPKPPVAAIVGGAKVSSKLDLLGNLIQKVDVLVLGGGMANTFLYAQGYDVKGSLHEPDMKDTALDILKKAKAVGCEIVLPRDVVCAKEFKQNAEHVTADIDAIPDGMMALDVGEKSVTHVTQTLENCKTILWNGPMGAFEIKPFDMGTSAVARYVRNKTLSGDMISIAGGGDTVSALINAGVDESFTYLSTAGGAFLEWLEGKELPGVYALKS